MSCKPPAPWPRPAKCRRHSKLTEQLRITLPRPARCWGCWCVTPFDRSAITGLIGVMDDAIDQMNQTLSLLPGCAKEENLTDLTLETDRACCQLQQIQQSFFGSF